MTASSSRGSPLPLLLVLLGVVGGEAAGLQRWSDWLLSGRSAQPEGAPQAAAGGGLYAAEAAWEEVEEVEEAEYEMADYVTELLAAEATQRRRLQTCDTLANTQLAGSPDMAGAAAGVQYVNGDAITQAAMDGAVVAASFACPAGQVLDTTATFVCAAANGEATLSGPACVAEETETPAGDDGAAEEEAEPACPEDPACRAEVSCAATRPRRGGRACVGVALPAELSRLLVCACDAGCHRAVLRRIRWTGPVHVPGVLHEEPLRQGRRRRSQE